MIASHSSCSKRSCISGSSTSNMYECAYDSRGACPSRRALFNCDTTHVKRTSSTDRPVGSHHFRSSDSARYSCSWGLRGFSGRVSSPCEHSSYDGGNSDGCLGGSDGPDGLGELSYRRQRCTAEEDGRTNLFILFPPFTTTLRLAFPAT